MQFFFHTLMLALSVPLGIYIGLSGFSSQPRHRDLLLVKYIALSLLMLILSLGLAAMFIPALWYHEWWPEIQRTRE